VKKDNQKRWFCPRHGFLPRAEKRCRSGHPNPYPPIPMPHVTVTAKVLDMSHNRWLVDHEGVKGWLADCIVQSVDDLGDMVALFTIPETIARDRGFIT